MNKVKLNYVLDAVMGLAFLLMGSGGYLGGQNAGYATALLGLSRGTWNDLHSWASVVMIVGIVVHVALHWKWIVGMTKKMMPSRPRRAQEQVCKVMV